MEEDAMEKEDDGEGPLQVNGPDPAVVFV